MKTKKRVQKAVDKETELKEVNWTEIKIFKLFNC